MIHKSRAVRFLSLLLTFCCVQPAFAQELLPDPFARNLIFVEGDAEMTVAIDGFSLRFGFDVDKASFQDASNDSARITEVIRRHLESMGLSEIEVIQGWDMVKQAKISFGSKGRKLSNVLTVRVLNFPAGKLHETIARAVDGSLAVDGVVALEDVEVFVSDKVAQAKQETVIQQALDNLNANAGRAATAVGCKISEPKRIFVINEENPAARPPSPARYDMLQSEMYESRAIVSVQKSFKVSAQILDQMKITAKVTGIYEIQKTAGSQPQV